MSQYQLQALALCKDHVSGRTRVALMLSCRFAGVLLSAEAARLRKLRVRHGVLDPALKLVVPHRLLRLTPAGGESDIAHDWLMTTGAPRENENAYWAHASPDAQAPWWLKELSEILMTWPLCSGNAYVYNCGCIGPYSFPDPDEHVPETFVRNPHHGVRMWDAQLRFDPLAGNFKVSNQDSIWWRENEGLIVDTYMVATELENRHWSAVMSGWPTLVNDGETGMFVSP